MKYEKKFNNPVDAMKEIESYVGKEQWNRVCNVWFPSGKAFDVKTKEARDQIMRDVIATFDMFLGVTGYPAVMFAQIVIMVHWYRLS